MAYSKHFNGMNQSLLYFVLFIIVYIYAPRVNAEVFKWVDEKGQVHYSDKKPENQNVQEINIKPHVPNAVSNTTDDVVVQSVAKLPTPYKKQQKVTMYAASWCGYCKKARSYFKRNKINYTEYDIEKNANAKKRYDKLGGVGVPLLVAKSKQMQGFSVTQFEKWYKAL